MGKVTAMTPDTGPTKDDLLMTVDAPGTTPGSRKVTIEDLFKALHVLTTLADPATGNDEVAIYDASAAAIRRIQVGDLLGADAGWRLDTDAWTYASATSFTIAAKDVTGEFPVGAKIRLKQGAGYKYFYVTSSSFSTNTTVNVTGGSDYTVANAGITDNYYSYAETPVGFPAAFNYTPTGISASGVTLTGRFKLNGNRCIVDFKAIFTGAITFTTMPTLPIPASANYNNSGGSLNYNPAGVLGYLDSGTTYVMNSFLPTIIASSTTFGIYSAATGTAMSASLPITWAGSDQIVAHFEYEV